MSVPHLNILIRNVFVNARRPAWFSQTPVLARLSGFDSPNRQFRMTAPRISKGL